MASKLRMPIVYSIFDAGQTVLDALHFMKWTTITVFATVMIRLKRHKFIMNELQFLRQPQIMPIIDSVVRRITRAT